MQYNPSSGSQGIVHHAYWLVGANSTKYLIADTTRAANIWYRRILGWIWEAVGGWKFDDANATTRPALTTTLVASQEDYTLPTAAGSSYGEIERVEVLDNAGNYKVLSRIDKKNIVTAVDEYLETDGMPKEYYIEGDSLILKPAPAAADVTTAAGLKIYPSRDIDEFTVSDTTQEPGFNRNWHVGIAIGAALEYAKRFVPERVPQLESDLGVNPRIQIPHGLKGDIQKYYRRRNETDRRQARRVLRESYV